MKGCLKMLLFQVYGFIWHIYIWACPLKVTISVYYGFQYLAETSVPYITAEDSRLARLPVHGLTLIISIPHHFFLPYSWRILARLSYFLVAGYPTSAFGRAINYSYIGASRAVSHSYAYHNLSSLHEFSHTGGMLWGRWCCLLICSLSRSPRDP